MLTPAATVTTGQSGSLAVWWSWKVAFRAAGGTAMLRMHTDAHERSGSVLHPLTFRASMNETELFPGIVVNLRAPAVARARTRRWLSKRLVREDRRTGDARGV